MSSVRHIHPARACIAIVMLCAWLLATNHCALGLMRAASGPKHEHCPGHAAPAKGGESDQGEMACCKTIHAAPLPAKLAVEPAKSFTPWQGFIVAVVEWAKVEAPVPSEALDTGPPFVLTFAESVLQRSLFGHAPPFAV